jgi:hypothetical protein
MMHYGLINPTITPYSTNDSIGKWIKEREAMEQAPEVLEAIRQAQKLRKSNEPVVSHARGKQMPGRSGRESREARI